MTEIQVITNNVPRPVIEAYELSESERAEFDYLDWGAIERGEDSASFIRYRGELYDLQEFMRWDGVQFSPLNAWHGYSADTFFSGIVIRYADDCGETVIVGRYYC